MAMPRRLREYLARQNALSTRKDSPRIRKSSSTGPQRPRAGHACRTCGVLQPRKRLTPEKTSLLTLPAELRNRIYEYALSSESTPHILARDLNRMPPPWLLSCKQLYTEALKIWFYVTQKHTVIEIDDLDARALIHWTKRRQKLKVPFNDPPVHCRLSYNWANLMVWCKAVWEAKVYWELSPSNGGAWASETNLVVWSALELASDYHDLPWEDCQQALGSLRNALSVYEPRWKGFWS